MFKLEDILEVGVLRKKIPQILMASWIIIVVIIVVIDMGCWNSRMFSIFRRLPVSISGGKKFHKFWISWLPVCRQSHEFNWKFDVLIVMFSMSNIPNAFRLWIFFLTKNIIIDWTRNGLEFNWSKVFQIPLFAQIVFQFILIKCPKWPRWKWFAGSLAISLWSKCFL